MDRNTVHLYEILGVPKSSSQDEIKKAYRRLALRYHPDKVNAAEVPDHETRFRDIAAAYEVLSDPKKRQVYDKYGMMGVQMAGTEIGARLVEIESLLCAIFWVVSVLIALTITFLSFLAVRIDDKVNWSYTIVFIPLWILDAVLVLSILYQFTRPVNEDEESHHDDEQEHGDGGSTTTADRENRKAQKLRERKRQLVVGTLFGLLMTLLFTAFQVLIAMKANDPTSITGPQVFAPYFALEGIFFLAAIIQLAIALKVAAAAEVPFASKLAVIFEALWWKVVRLALAVLIMLRIDGDIDCSWGIVFIPLYLVGVKYLVQLLLGYRAFSRMQSVEMRQQGQTMMVVGLVIFLVVGALFYSLIGLLAAKLDGQSYSVSRVLIPVFIVLSILLCCCGCCLPCMLLASGTSEEEMGSREGVQIRLVSPNLRIEGTNTPSGTNSSATAESSPSSSRRFGRGNKRS
ncbi:hypothetical protein BGX28_001603 [Mortierella sp. GBA30]|nr:hypothetical protein BGX28_001603 [Mortierella sp. GBA30]